MLTEKQIKKTKPESKTIRLKDAAGRSGMGVSGTQARRQLAAVSTVRPPSSPIGTGRHRR